MTWFTAILLSLLYMFAPLSTEAQEIDPARKYAQCMSLAETRPKEAREMAGQWIGLAGGEPARHCQAVAMIELGEYADAAKRLEALAEGSRSALEVRAAMLAQAAQAWVLHGDLATRLCGADGGVGTGSRRSRAAH